MTLDHAASRDVDFVGRLTASATHDLLNVLAIIQQSAGLMDDLLLLARKEKIKSLGLRKDFPYHDRLKEMMDQIGVQLKRGMALTEDLNRLAHSHESAPSGMCDLRGLCSTLAGLALRQVRKHKCRLEVTAGPTVAAPINGLTALRALGGALEAVLVGCQEADIRLEVSHQEGRPQAVLVAPTQDANALHQAAAALHREFGPQGIDFSPCPAGLAVLFPATAQAEAH